MNNLKQNLVKLNFMILAKIEKFETKLVITNTIKNLVHEENEKFGIEFHNSAKN